MGLVGAVSWVMHVGGQLALSLWVCCRRRVQQLPEQGSPVQHCAARFRLAGAAWLCVPGSRTPAAYSLPYCVPITHKRAMALLPAGGVYLFLPSAQQMFLGSDWLLSKPVDWRNWCILAGWQPLGWLACGGGWLALIGESGWAWRCVKAAEMRRTGMQLLADVCCSGLLESGPVLAGC